MAKFVKGDKSIPRPGRPKGSKDKKYLTLQYWYDELMKDWDKLSPAQRAKLSKECMQMLTSKMKNMPSSPDDSVANAKEAQELLSSFEHKNNDLNEVKAQKTPVPPEN